MTNVRKIRTKKNFCIEVNLPIRFIIHDNPSDDYFAVYHPNHICTCSGYERKLLKIVTTKFGGLGNKEETKCSKQS